MLCSIPLFAKFSTQPSNHFQLGIFLAVVIQKVNIANYLSRNRPVALPRIGQPAIKRFRGMAVFVLININRSNPSDNIMFYVPRLVTHRDRLCVLVDYLRTICVTYGQTARRQTAIT